MAEKISSLVAQQRQIYTAQSNARADGTLHKGRGATFNPASRFDSQERCGFDDGWATGWDEQDEVPPQTVVHPDKSQTILSDHDSPDLGHGRTLNPYRGCEHGCIYCYARPTHNHFGLSSGLDFETRLFAKHDAALLLRTALAKRNYQPKTILLGGVTDPYQPIERELKITRAVLEVLGETRHPFAVITKSAALLRDLDLLTAAASNGTGSAAVSITTLNSALARKLEPRAHHPAKRLAAVRKLSEAGVPTTVMLAPIIPGLNDHEIEPLLQAASDAGAESAGYTLLRLPWDLKELFEDWLEAHYPDRKDRVLSLIRQTRNGKLYEHSWEWRRRGRGPVAELIAERFALGKRRYGLANTNKNLRTDLFIPPAHNRNQLQLFAKDDLRQQEGGADKQNPTWMGVAEGS